MLKIEVNLDSSDVDAALTRLIRAMDDTTPLMMELAQVMAEESDRAFEGETDPITGAKWPRLNADYKRQRAEAGHTGPMLQRNGTLRTSMHQEYGHLYARYGTNLTYAAIHCFGGITRAHWIRPRNGKALAWRRPAGQARHERDHCRLCPQGALRQIACRSICGPVLLVCVSLSVFLSLKKSNANLTPLVSVLPSLRPRTNLPA